MAGQYLIPLSGRDRAGLEWLQQRTGYWIRAMARRRKFLEAGPYSECEILVGNALIELQKAAAILLGDDPVRRHVLQGVPGSPPPETGKIGIVPEIPGPEGRGVVGP